MARQQNKDLHQKHQAILSRLLKEDDNKYCVDCDAKGPRWASWNIGVFLCIRCAGIHRNLGVHISKVKSINLDSWTAEQIASVEDMGNSRARAIYEANLPDHYKRPSSSDSAMEQFVRAKYEHKKYIAKEWVPSKPRSVPSHYYDKEEPKKEAKKAVKTVLTIPGAAAGTSAVARTSTAEKNTPAPVKAEYSAPSLMVDLSSPAKQATSAKPTSSSDLLKDLFTNPEPTPSTAASGDLFGLSSVTAPAQSSGDTSEDLFKVKDEPGSSAKDSIMALFGNSAAPQPNMMTGGYNMPGAQAQPSVRMSTAYVYDYQRQQTGTGSANMMGGYSMAGQQPNMMMSSQTAGYQQYPGGMMGQPQQGMMAQPQQGMMGQPQQRMMGQPQQGMIAQPQQGIMGHPQQGIMGQPQQGMMGQPQHGMMGMNQQTAFANPQMQQQFYSQQMQAQMANLNLNQQQMNGMAKQAVGSSGASWGNASAQANGQTLNGALWN